jgi:hypothetical protein
VKQVAFTFGQADAAINYAKRVVRANTGPLEELDLLTGLLAYLSVTDYLTEPHFEGKVTEEIMDMLGVRERAALEYKRKFREKVGRELEARNPVLLAIIRELATEPPIFVAATDAETEDNRRLLRESRQPMAEYTREEAA